MSPQERGVTVAAIQTCPGLASPWARMCNVITSSSKIPTFRCLDLCGEIQAACFHSIRGFVRLPVTPAFHYIQLPASGNIILT